MASHTHNFHFQHSNRRYYPQELLKLTIIIITSIDCVSAFARHFTNCCTYVNTTVLRGRYCFYSSFLWGNGTREKLQDLSRVTQLINGHRAKTQPSFSEKELDLWSQVDAVESAPCLEHSALVSAGLGPCPLRVSVGSRSQHGLLGLSVSSRSQHGLQDSEWPPGLSVASQDSAWAPGFIFFTIKCGLCWICLL